MVCLLPPPPTPLFRPPIYPRPMHTVSGCVELGPGGTTQVVEGWFEAPVTLRVKWVWLVPQLASQLGCLPTER